ncbi:Acyl-CoA N-acyltransferase with RING/FYVE/PHD-type zinc finger protein [Trifolium repens]|nr:Acyl-CoA N-acyltransferase with RING/FYVE/PHD-type zinc finger protein [Trifolium repens]
MEPSARIASPSGVVVKNRSSSGCLIVRKKGDGLGDGVGGGSSSRKQYESKKVRKKPKADSSDSESSGELRMPSARRIGPETIRVCNSLSALERGGNVGSGEISRKRERMEQIRRNGDGMVEGNGLERRDKKIKLDVFDFDEYDGVGVERMRRRQFDNDGVGLGGGRFTGTMHSGRGSIDREFETGSSKRIVDKRKNSYYDKASGLHLGDSADHSRIKMKKDGTQRPLPLMKEKFNSDESIRVQGKNGVLKVMVNKKKVGGSAEHYDHRKSVESRQSLRAEGTSKRNVPIRPSSHLETKSAEKQGLFVRPEKKQITKKSLSSKEDSKGDEQDSDNNDTSMNLEVKNIKAHTSSKKITSENEQTPVHDKLPTTKSSEGKIRDYLDAVYINPAGTAYWSIIKAYDALQKQLIEDDQQAKAKGESSSFAPIADDVLSQLTRKTRKKMEKDLKMKKKKQRLDDGDGGKERQIKRITGKKQHMSGIDSDSNEDKLSSFVKQGSKSMKTKLTENAVTGGSSKSQNVTAEKSISESDPQILLGRKSRKHGRCTLLVRSSNKGLNSESDDFVPYTGKRTVLSWLVDSGVVQVSQKVQYRRRKRVMLEGWITREGIHCGCCSKILTVSKFELHAGSKLPQPYQNIYLDSGVSLLQCQIDAWEKQENFGKISFHSVDVDGNDPNDDTCGICGDGGDLICCDGCPSTFHQSCLDIQMLPPGEWRCPNCTCKFCGLANGTIDKEDNATVYALRTCDLCEKKYHDSCTKDMGVHLADSNMSGHSFCGKSCKELFEQLKKYLGTKHELDAGFTWCLVRRTDDDSEAASRGVTQRVECNSKLAVALTVMDECFLPVVDRRSGINIIHNSLYNSG